MGNIRNVESVLAADRTLAVGVQNCPLEVLPPVTLQVVLRGTDGIVIASDTRMESHRSERKFRMTDSISKIVVTPKLVYTFAGDNCAKEIGEAVSKEVAANPQPLSADFIGEASNSALEKYKMNLGNEFVEMPRKIIWVQVEGAGFAVWSALYDIREGQFKPYTHPAEFDGKFGVFAGDESNQARYIVEYYYKNDNYLLRNISSLTRIAAHMILTGGLLNSTGVGGLEMVVGNSSGFARVPTEELRELAELSRRIHEENNKRFSDQDYLP
jgi:hypothetical protein